MPFIYLERYVSFQNIAADRNIEMNNFDMIENQSLAKYENKL